MPFSDPFDLLLFLVCKAASCQPLRAPRVAGGKGVGGQVQRQRQQARGQQHAAHQRVVVAGDGVGQQQVDAGVGEHGFHIDAACHEARAHAAQPRQRHGPHVGRQVPPAQRQRAGAFGQRHFHEGRAAQGHGGRARDENGSYARVRGLFGNTECAATGEPDAAELALMQPLRAHIPPAAFGPAYEPPRTDGSEHGLRHNLRRAQALLREAGWKPDAAGTLRNASGQALELDYLDSAETGARVVTPWMRNLEKIGVRLHFRPVDFALYQQRLQKFDFDITTLAFQGSLVPGQEYADIFGSRAAATEGSGNYVGAANPAIDTLIARMVAARQRSDFLAACRAGARHHPQPLPAAPVVRPRAQHGLQRLAATAPAVTPAYFQAESWAIWTWWARAGVVSGADLAAERGRFD